MPAAQPGHVQFSPHPSAISCNVNYCRLNPPKCPSSCPIEITSGKCGSGNDALYECVASNTSTTIPVNTSTGTIKHVVIIMLENQEFNSTLYSHWQTQAPYMWSLANPIGTGKYAFADQFFAVRHSSLPNYLTLIAGSTVGISSACDPSTCGVSYNSIANLLDFKGLSWKTYQESMPTPCDMSNSGNYVTKHNPFIFFKYITSNTTYCDAHVVPLSPNLNNDLASNTLPAYSFITPNACNDGDNNCGEGTAYELNYTDKWLAGFFASVSFWFKLPNANIFSIVASVE